MYSTVQYSTLHLKWIKKVHQYLFLSSRTTSRTTFFDVDYYILIYM